MMKSRTLLLLASLFLLAGCESQSRLLVDSPVETATDTNRLQLFQSVTSAGTAVVIPLPTNAQTWAGLPQPPQPLYSADRVAIAASGASREFARTTMVLPVSPVATANVPVLSTFVSAPISTDRAGNANVLLVLDGRQATVYRSTVTTR